MMYARIAFPIPGQGIFDYLIPHHLQGCLQIGMRVRVPLGKRMATGFCVELQHRSDVPIEKLREIHAVLDQWPVVDDSMSQFARWWAEYYYCSLGEALSATVPSEIGAYGKSSYETLVQLERSRDIPGQIALLDPKNPAQARILRFLEQCDQPIEKQEIQKKLHISPSSLKALQKKGLIHFVYREKDLDPFAGLPLSEDPIPVELTPDQRRVVDDLIQAIDRKTFETFLLFGITGSGKTEIYIQAIRHCIARGRQAIVLVPEIALTPQTVMRFRQRFSEVAVLHSELTAFQRAHQWGEINEGKVPVAIGARSALFAPTKNLGIIVVDEEHEPSFKQQNTPRYHARDLAVKRAQMSGAVALLGSATPSIESYYNAITGKYRLHKLPHRIGEARLPEFTVVDMKDEFREQKKFVFLSRFLIWQIRRCLEAGEQIILFLNRRGFAPAILCPMCGYRARCEHCDIGLTYHEKSQRALCHYCGYDMACPEKCPVCGLEGIRLLGAGTQRIEKMLHGLFPQAKMMRMDSDTMTTRRRYEEAFLAFSRRELDILLGTQMVAKGLDFPYVTLVGIICADITLQLPDLRAAERTFQLMVQVGGRAGRAQKPGKVILQTFHPEHYAITAASAQDYEKFASHELAMRQELNYPPFGRLLRVILEGRNEQKVICLAEDIASTLKKLDLKADILGPAPAPIAKIKNRYRWHLIIKSRDLKAISACAHALEPFIPNKGQSKILLDRDPISMV